MGVRVIEDEHHFQSELSAAGIRLVVVDFTATWYVFYSSYLSFHREFAISHCCMILPSYV